MRYKHSISGIKRAIFKEKYIFQREEEKRILKKLLSTVCQKTTVLEFGVSTGDTLKIINDLTINKEIEVHGYDSFQGFDLENLTKDDKRVYEQIFSDLKGNKDWKKPFKYGWKRWFRDLDKHTHVHKMWINKENLKTLKYPHPIGFIHLDVDAYHQLWMLLNDFIKTFW